MTSIDKYLKEFEDFFNGDLGDSEKAAFKERLASDSEMQSAWKEYQSIMKAISNKEAVSFRIMLNNIYQNKYENIRLRQLSENLWFRLSAAAIFIVTVGCLLYFFCTKEGQNLATKHSTDIQKEDLYAMTKDTMAEANSKAVMFVKNDTTKSYDISGPIVSLYDDEKYQISPAYVGLLHNVYRSNWFSLVSPRDSILIYPGDSIVFSWETNIREPLFFDVLDRHGKVVFSHQDSIESPWSYKPKLSPSIYMFRFSTKDQPVWMGVILGVEK